VITIRRAGERLRTRIGWLDSRHSFSFEEHIDPRHMGFRALRVLNEDRVSPRAGFGTHPHRDVEIVTYVLKGELHHQDTLGTGSVVRPDDFQRITAGTGVLHSELNASPTEPLHFLQIWLTPERPRLPPSYERRTFPASDRRGRITLVGSRDGRDGSITIHQDVAMYSVLLGPREAVAHPLRAGRHAWVHVVGGRVELNHVSLDGGDGAAVSDEVALQFRSSVYGEALLFDLA
jgi:redox-sensitive bicupin YhaK (pirin superfamily)